MADYTTQAMTGVSLLADILTADAPPAGALGWAIPDGKGGFIDIPLGDLSDPDASSDLFAFTDAQRDAIMALAYTNCDAAPADSPTWSRNGMTFDAIDPADGGNYHYYCGYATYVPGSSTQVVSPAWHRVEKLGADSAGTPQPSQRDYIENNYITSDYIN
jgi:hypothetical protein